MSQNSGEIRYILQNQFDQDGNTTQACEKIHGNFEIALWINA